MFSGGDGRTLDLDFTGGVLDGRITFSRSSTTATFINSSGLVASASTNVPRFDYNPTTLVPRGLLIEGQATNLLNWSETFATSGGATNWAYNSNTGTTVSETNPAGGSTSFQFAETVNSGPLQQSVTVTNNIHTFSAWFRGSTYSGTTTTQVQLGLFTTGFVAGSASIISGSGSVSVAGNVVTLSGLSTSTWTRVQFTTTAALAAGSVAILIYPNTTSLNLNASFLIWGAQLEAASAEHASRRASSYIPTGASQATRNADNVSMTGTNFSSWFQQAPFSCVIKAEPNDASANNRILNISDGTGNNRIIVMSSQRQLIVWSGGTGQISIGAGVSIMENATSAYRVQDSNFYAFTRTASGTTYTASASSGTCPVNVNVMGIGQASSNANLWNGWISRIIYWPTALPDATLQSLTQ